MRIKVLVIGGSGRLGSALSIVGGAHVHALSSSALDISDFKAVYAALDQLRPDAVINAAALSSVEVSEKEPERARSVNATAPGRVAQACAQHGIPFIHISTDYVFGEGTDRPWREADPVSPINSYGRLKAEGERNVLTAGQGACVARVAWLFGDGKDFITHLLRNQTGRVEVTYDQVGSPTPIFALARRLLELAERMRDGMAVSEILHLAGSPPVSRADWVMTAFEALQRAGRRTPELVRVSMSDLSSSVPRPAFSALDCSLAASLFGSELDWRAIAARPETFTDIALSA